MVYTQSMLRMWCAGIFFLGIISVSIKSEVVVDPIPKTEQEILELAQQFFHTPTYMAFSEEMNGDSLDTSQYHCGHPDMMRVLQALDSTLISSEFRENVLVSLSALNTDKKLNYPTYYPNFDVYYDSTAISESEVMNTAYYLQAAFNLYKQFFKIETGFNDIITVYVYPFDKNIDTNEIIAGTTNPLTNEISLNTDYLKISWCFRKNVAVHELFHLVQYAYGLDVDPDKGLQDYWVEASATLAEKVFGNVIETAAPTVEYIGEMNDWIKVPNEKFWLRNYDATYFWVYLMERYQERIGNNSLEAQVVLLRFFLKNYKKGLRKEKLFNKLTQKIFDLNFHAFLHETHESVLLKDVNINNAVVKQKYDIAEDHNVSPSCNKAVYTLDTVNEESSFSVVSKDSTWNYTSFVYAGGANYYWFDANTDFRIEVKNVKGYEKADYYFSLVFLDKNTKTMVGGKRFKGSKISYRVQPVGFDAVVLIVSSKDNKGGRYQIRINPPRPDGDINGIWYQSNMTISLSLNPGSMTIDGHTISGGEEVWYFWGTQKGNAIELFAFDDNDNIYKIYRWELYGDLLTGYVTIGSTSESGWVISKFHRQI